MMKTSDPMNIPYTRITETRAFAAARARYDANGLTYHNWDHVKALYTAAALLGLDYDPALDFAILFHDVVYDLHGNNEIRSIEFARKFCGELPYWGKIDELIRSTIAHDPIHPDPRLAVIDLCSFVDPVRQFVDTENLRRESMLLKKADYDFNSWRLGSIAYQQSLLERVQRCLPVADLRYASTWLHIANGIQRSLDKLQQEMVEVPA